MKVEIPWHLFILISFFHLIGTVSVILSDPPCKDGIGNDAMTESKWWNLNLIINVTLYLNKTRIWKSFLHSRSNMGTLVNRTFSYLHEGPLEIILAVYLSNCRDPVPSSKYLSWIKRWKFKIISFNSKNLLKVVPCTLITGKKELNTYYDVAY